MTPPTSSLVEAVARAISGVPFPSEGSKRKARAILVGFWDPQQKLVEKISALLTEHAESLDALDQDPSP